MIAARPAFLFSFEYLRSSELFKDMAFWLVREKIADVLIDSGAFSAHRLGKVIQLSEYCAFIHAAQEMGEWYGFIQLDVIGNYKVTMRNLYEMVRRGIKPMPVLTVDMPIDRVAELCDINPRVCVAGALTSKAGEPNWIRRRYQEAFDGTEGKSRIHGLAFVRWPQMFSVPIASCDLSSLAAGGRFGKISMFNKEDGAIWVGCSASPPEKWNDQFKDFIARCGVSPDDWHDPQVRRSGMRTFSTLSTIFSSLCMSVTSRRWDRLVFLATVGPTWLMATVAVAEASSSDMSYFNYHRASETYLWLRDASKKDQRAMLQRIKECFDGFAQRVNLLPA